MREQQHASVAQLWRYILPPTKSAIVASLGLLLTFACWLIYGHLNFYRDPGSIFYDESRAHVRWYSAERQEQAEAFMKRAADGKLTDRFSNGGEGKNQHPNIAVCGTFLTVARDGLERQYVETSIASALDRVAQEERDDLNLKVFFADSDPTRHPSWHVPWICDAVDEVYSYSNFSPSALKRARKLDNTHNSFGKSPFDYASALQYCYDKTKARYIAMFEDDIILAEGWFARALLGLQDVERDMLRQKKAGKWLDIRLFNQERSTGWKSQKIGGNQEIPISLGIGLVLWTICRLSRRNSRLAHHYLDNWTIAFTCCIAVPAFVIMFYQSGKASLLPPTAGAKEEFFGCCAQGIVFNRQHVPGLVKYMQNEHKSGQDLIARDYAWYQGLSRWAIYPMSIQHIGAHSTIQKKDKESQAVWSMAFENLDADQLHVEHLDMVQKLYGKRVDSVG